MSYVLEIQDLKKSFGKVNAVQGVSFGVKEGTCFGLLGPNGAGKTTTIEMIENITNPDSGEILYKGQKFQKGFLSEFGIQFQETSLPLHLTVREALETFRDLYPIAMETDDLVKLCRLSEFQHQRHSQISGGQKQRLLLAIALCNDPNLILLDEPTTGLDPQARRHLWDIVKNIKKQRKTLILTTHYMEEAYELCDEIGIIDHGKLIAYGQPKSLLKEFFKQVFIQVPKEAIKGSELLQELKFTESDKYYEISTEDLNQMMKMFMAEQIDLSGIQIRQSNLEDLFIELTGKDLRA